MTIQHIKGFGRNSMSTNWSGRKDRLTMQDWKEDRNDSRSSMRENFDVTHRNYSLKEMLAMFNQEFFKYSG